MTEEEFHFRNKYQEILKPLSHKEMEWLNALVVERLNTMDRLKDLEAVSAFKRGDKVKWVFEGISYEGWVSKTHQKTVTVTELQEPYRKWKITPEYLKKV